jgi:hypothetical protein
MVQSYNMFGPVTIVLLYGVIGVTAARGTMCVFNQFLQPKSHQFCYAIFLVVIAGLYLAFVSYFNVATAWRLESAVVLVFAVISLLGTRFTLVLITGYVLHGVWDLVHELEAHGALSAFPRGQLSTIPLAYGIFCLVFDCYMAVHFYKQRAVWRATRKVVSR